MNWKYSRRRSSIGTLTKRYQMTSSSHEWHMLLLSITPSVHNNWIISRPVEASMKKNNYNINIDKLVIKDQDRKCSSYSNKSSINMPLPLRSRTGDQGRVHNRNHVQQTNHIPKSQLLKRDINNTLLKAQSSIFKLKIVLKSRNC